MLFAIQPDSPIPINDQVVAQVIFGVASGSLQVGELIPSVRDLAGRLLVHPNTVAKAFQKLEQQGIITARRGKGMEVTPGAPAACRAQRQDIVRRRLRDALREAASSALEIDTLRQIVEEELAHIRGQRP